MPYKSGGRLGAEYASKLGHLDVIQSELVNKLIDSFEHRGQDDSLTHDTVWEDLNDNDIEPLSMVLAVDGSFQTISSDGFPIRELSFVKTAFIKLDPNLISKIDPDFPHPLEMKKVMDDAVLYHSTVFPLKNVGVDGMSNYDLIRKIIRDSLKDPSIGGEVHNTLKWLAYRKWRGDESVKSMSFDCPVCRERINGLPYDSDQDICASCKSEVYISDMIGFHLEIGEDVAPESLSSAYMLVHETLFLFSMIRYYWDKKWLTDLSNCLFVKDGPLTLRGQYSKLVEPIREFLDFAKKKGCLINIVGQEKTGVLATYLDSHAPYIEPKKMCNASKYKILSHYEVQSDICRWHIDPKNMYGLRTNYGEKVFVKFDPYHHMVISVPTGLYVEDQSFPKEIQDFIGLDRILKTLKGLMSSKHQSGLVPIELANSVASLSSYPSAGILKVFSKISKG